MNNVDRKKIWHEDGKNQYYEMNNLFGVEGANFRKMVDSNYDISGAGYQSEKRRFMFESSKGLEAFNKKNLAELKGMRDAAIELGHTQNAEYLSKLLEKRESIEQ